MASSVNTEFHLGEFRSIKKLGDGKFGKVVLVSTAVDHKLSTFTNDHENKDSRDTSTSTGNEFYYAIKIINQKKLSKSTLNYSNVNNLAKIKNEVQIIDELNKFNHPNLLKMYSIINNENNDKIYFVMDYCSLGEINPMAMMDLPKGKNPIQNIQSKLRNIVNDF
ncbi:unnamed protein product [Ambrosiozyma monospora]|uniref:Unnamed protein product n=1 Tax=Ambrosiozyma monospora TaxID=43982 RepID=A0ACB5TYD3_AMBMO|nr:unnamed protein product [Ambrosiozyma monospora]